MFSVYLNVNSGKEDSLLLRFTDELRRFWTEINTDGYSNYLQLYNMKTPVTQLSVILNS